MMLLADPCLLLERKVSTRLHDDETHRIVTLALTEVALAAIHPARHLGVGRSASGGMLEEPIEDAARAAVETLVLRLEDLVELLPRVTVDELVGEQVLAEHGLE